jgi:hypothetical protein
VRQWRGQSNSVSAFLWQGLSKPQQLVLKNYQPPASSPKQAQEVVLQALNEIVGGPSIYESHRFAGLSLRSETIDLTNQSPAGLTLARFNRLLLEDAYPSELSRSRLGLSGSQLDFWQIVVSVSFLEIPALLWIALFLRQHHAGWKEAFGFQTGNTAGAVAYGIMAGVLYVPAAWTLQTISSQLMNLLHLVAQQQQMVQEVQDASLTVPQKIFLGVFAVMVAPVVEELLFRGILYPAIKRRGWPRLALWGSSAFFALVHGNMASFVPLLVFALMLVQLYESFDNLLAPMVAHSLFNAANFLTITFQDQIARFLHLT